MPRFSIGVALWLALSMAAPAGAQPCTCIDVGDIKQRIKEAETAINAYSTEIQKMLEQMQRTQDPLPYTPERRLKLQARVQTALNQVTAGRISTAPTIANENPGGTSNICTMTINLHPSATACMRESVKRHEQHHQSECAKTLPRIGDSILHGKDRFERQQASLVQYAMEEIAGYTTEIRFLQSELARLQRSEECRPRPKPELRDFTGIPRKTR